MEPPQRFCAAVRTDLPNFTNGTFLLRFLFFGVLGGPLVAGLLMSVIAYFVWHSAPATTLREWLSSDCVGIALATPLFVALFQNSLQGAVKRRSDWLYLVLLVAATIAVFAQSRVPILFLLYPFLLLVQLRLGVGWTALWRPSWWRWWAAH